MCVNQITMVPAVVNLVASKGKETYTGIVSEFTCCRCRVFTTPDKDIEVSNIWRHTNNTTSNNTNSKNDKNNSSLQQNAFIKYWKKNAANIKLTTSSSLPSTTTTTTTTTTTSQPSPPKTLTTITTDTTASTIKHQQQELQKIDKNLEDGMSLLKFLAINALDLSAPATDVLLKSRTTSWFQLSGHPDSLAPAGPGSVWKKRSPGTDDTERLVYEQLTQDPNLVDIIPRYYREVEYQGEKFIELQNLLHGFQDPYVIDIKMGTRTFLESEVQKKTARPDLYQKMIAIDPTAPTEEENRKKAVTKLRYMQFRELQSSTCSHGFRIEAMKCRGTPPVTDLKKVKSDDEVFNTLDMFLGERKDVIQRLLQRLCEIRTKIEQSNYFQTHEVIGASLFIIYDDKKIGVWLIDFAKTNKVPNGITVNHRKPWIQGNYEEGLLFGMDRLIDIIKNLNSFPSSNESMSKTMPTVSVKS